MLVAYLAGGGNLKNSKVINSTIEGISSNSISVGGISGMGGWCPTYSYVKDSQVISKGINVGGIVGKSTTGISQVYAENVLVDGYANVGGLAGYAKTGYIYSNYTNANVIATEHSAGGLIGYWDNEGMDNLNNISQIIGNYYASGTIKSKEYVGGIIGEAVEELYMPEKNYRQNYVEANLISENSNTISLGVGNRHKSNKDLEKTYYYKYSKINGKYPTKENEPYIPNESYLIEEELKKEDTYKNKLVWGNNFSYDILNESKYPVIRYGTEILEGQEGIRIPEDPPEEEILQNLSIYDNRYLENESLNQTLMENVQYTFNYNGKTIKTYETYSDIIAEDNSKTVRNDMRLYVKDGNLYALPVTLDIAGNRIKLVENNFIIDTYNGKEYETVLGSNGRMYDLKEPITYPENFVNEEIESIGNNLNIDFHEVEVTYKNGDKVKFNYQTGKIISSSESDTSDRIGLFDYIKVKISEMGDSSSNTADEISNKYEESKELQTKLKKTSVEEAIEKQNVCNVVQEESVGTATESNETNNSYKDNKYISIYNEKTREYEIYNEEELLDTSKEEVLSENEKIEANNLNEYYVKEGETKNTKMGVVWIVISIIGVGIVLFVLKKNLKKRA